MDRHYDWSSSEFRSRAGESINLAVNYLSDVLHGFWLAGGQPIPQIRRPFVTRRSHHRGLPCKSRLSTTRTIDRILVEAELDNPIEAPRRFGVSVDSNARIATIYGRETSN